MKTYLPEDQHKWSEHIAAVNDVTSSAAFAHLSVPTFQSDAEPYLSRYVKKIWACVPEGESYDAAKHTTFEQDMDYTVNQDVYLTSDEFPLTTNTTAIAEQLGKWGFKLPDPSEETK